MSIVRRGKRFRVTQNNHLIVMMIKCPHCVLGVLFVAKYQVDSIQSWGSFEYNDVSYSLSHLDAHEVVFNGRKEDYKFIVTYSMHCFAKEETPFNVPVVFSDGRESKPVCMERYEASKQLRTIINGLHDVRLYKTDNEKFFTFHMMNSATNKIEPYKVCIVFFKEKRLLRMHVLTAFFAREGLGSQDSPIDDKKVKSESFFKIAMDTKARPKNAKIPKEALNRER